MKNELTPLEALERIKNAPTIYVGCASDVYTRYSFECNIIEKTLKAYEHLEENINKLKALELIRKVSESSLRHFINTYIKDDNERKIIKEVLLWQ